MLHVTNGDSTIYGLRESGVPGEFLAWRDPLHDGPVPACESLQALSRIRARALADFGWADFGAIHADFCQRDAALAGFRRHKEVVLWFEHDLYDQLQLLQILDWFYGQDKAATQLSLIQIDKHPEVIPFHGLGQLNGPQLAALFPERQPVTAEQLESAHRRWMAFTAGALDQLSMFPRLLEELPAVGDGLSRLERQILRAAEAGASTQEELYRQSRQMEDVPWGDSSVYLRVDGLTSGLSPALARDGAHLRLTERGKALLRGEDDWAAAGLDRWLGGLHLTSGPDLWRWNQTSGTLVQSHV